MVQRLSGGVVRPPQSSTDCCVLTQIFQAVSETRMKPNSSCRARLCIAAPPVWGVAGDYADRSRLDAQGFPPTEPPRLFAMIAEHKERPECPRTSVSSSEVFARIRSIA